MITQIILLCIIFLLILCNTLFVYKYLKLKKGLKSYSNIGTGRYGYYKYVDNSYSFYNGWVYVFEIDKYTNGLSKIKIDKIEATNKNYIKDCDEKARNKFLSMKLSSEIEWLESEDHIKKLRREKLEKINKI